MIFERRIIESNIYFVGFDRYFLSFYMNILTPPLSIGFIESIAGPSGESVEKDKGKKNSKVPRGKEEKDFQSHLQGYVYVGFDIRH